jgi:hypothetical protein
MSIYTEGLSSFVRGQCGVKLDSIISSSVHVQSKVYLQLVIIPVTSRDKNPNHQIVYITSHHITSFPFRPARLKRLYKRNRTARTFWLFGESRLFIWHIDSWSE